METEKPDDEKEVIPEEPSGASLTLKRSNQADSLEGAKKTWELILALLPSNKKGSK